MISFCIRIYSDYSDLLLKIYISQGSVATHLRCGVYVVTSLLQIFHRMCRWKKIWKSVSIWRRHGQKYVA